MNVITRDEVPVLAKKPDPGLCNSHEGRFLKVFKANIIDNLKSHLFCFDTFGVRPSIDVLDPENPPGSGFTWGAFTYCIGEVNMQGI